MPKTRFSRLLKAWVEGIKEQCEQGRQSCVGHAEAQARMALCLSYPQTPRPLPRKEDTVSEKTKRPEPSRPPWMVSHSVEANWRLYICIPAKSSRDRREDSASEVPVPTTGGDERRGGVRRGTPSRSCPQIHQVPELESPTDSQHSRAFGLSPTAPGDPQEFLSPERQAPCGPVQMPAPWNPGHVSSAGRGPGKLVCSNSNPH